MIRSTMNLHRVKPAVLIASAIMAVSIPLATTAQATTTSATIASQRPAVTVGCDYYVTLLHYDYYEADKSRGLVWWAQSSSANSNKPAELENKSSSSKLDCFKVEAGFGNGRVQFLLANSSLCLKAASNGQVDLSFCGTNPTTTLWFVLISGLKDDSFSFKNASSGDCIDLSHGYRAGSILVQKACKNADKYQAWFAPS
jgi:hypothetical protein